jgi:hypothetical protein
MIAPVAVDIDWQTAAAQTSARFSAEYLLLCDKLQHLQLIVKQSDCKRIRVD